MKYRVHSAEDLGLLLRAVRKHARVRQDDFAATVGVSKQFASDVENGKPTAQLGLVLKLLSEAGVTLNADIPDSAGQEFAKLKSVRAARNVAVHRVNAKS
jgi:DNA-binding XRE family transcriptional regulator